MFLPVFIYLIHIIGRNILFLEVLKLLFRHKHLTSSHILFLTGRDLFRGKILGVYPQHLRFDAHYNILGYQNDRRLFILQAEAYLQNPVVVRVIRKSVRQFYINAVYLQAQGPAVRHGHTFNQVSRLPQQFQIADRLSGIGCF